jgi:hypothetical protein
VIQDHTIDIDMGAALQQARLGLFAGAIDLDDVLQLALGPTCIITTISAVLIRGLPIASWITAERHGILVIAVTRSEVGLPPVVIAIAVVRGATVPTIRRVSVSLVVARVVVARVEIHIAALR